MLFRSGRQSGDYDNDGNGYRRFGSWTREWDSGFGEQGRGDKRRDRHGTHVAGIIGAKANGSMGVGVAPDVTLYSGNVYPTDQEQTLIL